MGKTFCFIPQRQQYALIALFHHDPSLINSAKIHLEHYLDFIFHLEISKPDSPVKMS